jgi:hypothetical protein
MRPPTNEELNGLVESYVRDEILYREGVAMGLDRDDAVIKRRVRQKLEVMTEEQLAAKTPDDGELSAYLAKNTERFTQPAVLSFEQILLDGSQAQFEQTLADIQAALARGEAAESLGQTSMLPYRLEQAPMDLVARDFGQTFADQVGNLPLGQWRGPITSGLGVHLVRVSEHQPASVPPLEVVRSQVAREWENEQRERSRSETYQQLRSRYQVIVEPRSATSVVQQP